MNCTKYYRKPKILTIYPGHLPSITGNMLQGNMLQETCYRAMYYSKHVPSNRQILFSLLSLYLTLLLHLESSHNASNQQRCLDHNDLNNYQPVSNLCIAKILEKLVLSQVSPQLSQPLQYLSISISSRSQH